MSKRKVNYVNVITHAGAVGRWIVVTKNFNKLPPACRDLQGNRNQMSFRRVIFTKALTRAGRVEIAESGKLKTTCLLVTAHRLFEDQLGSAVRICRAAAGGFCDRLLFRFAMLWIGIQLALVAGKPEMVQAVQILVWPVGFLSNAFADPTSMPGWLGTVVEWNPMSQTATAVRDLLGGPGGEAGHIWAAVVWPLGLLAVFFPLAVRRFARLSR